MFGRLTAKHARARRPNSAHFLQRLRAQTSGARETTLRVNQRARIKPPQLVVVVCAGKFLRICLTSHKSRTRAMDPLR